MKILVVAAHPDDEILGCGGTIARLVKEGHEAYTLILGEGVTSRDTERDSVARKEELNALNGQVKKANDVIGVKEVITENIPDNRFDSVDLLDIVKKIEQVKARIKPDVIFTHYAGDLNIDHKVTAEAVLTATRPMVGETVKKVYSFEVLSSTEWNYPLSFSPNTYFDITETIELKKKAMKEYQSEIREFPHPRSVEGIELSAKYWGMRVGQDFTEAFLNLRTLE